MSEACFFWSSVVSVAQEVCWGSGDMLTLPPWPAADLVIPQWCLPG